MKRGKQLPLLGRASNKGGVGLPFRLYDASVAAVTAHMASDSRGRSRREQRDKDARQVGGGGGAAAWATPYLRGYLRGLGLWCCWSPGAAAP